jgi:dihydrofolate synthase / folylpolyglutamate synthase
MKKVNDYKKNLRYLNAFINYEKELNFSYEESINLDRVKFLFRNYNINPASLNVIHIAGTNGKGSVAAFIANILVNSGFKVGIYTSPHLYDIRERIQILEKKDKKNFIAKYISKEEFSELVNRFKPVLSQTGKQKHLGSVSFFEVLTALAFKYYSEKNVDFAVIECGLGGRLDATNLSRPRVSVITRIGYDHAMFLGGSISEIASEKAGIIKESVPVVSSNKTGKVYRVLKNKADLVKAPLFLYRKDFYALRARVNSKETKFDFSSGLAVIKDLVLYLKGKHQVENACLAVYACLLLKKMYPVSLYGLRQGLKNTFMPGRFEIFNDNGRIFIFDIAHNPQAIDALGKAIKTYFPKNKIILVFGSSRDKNYIEMLKLMDYNILILTRANNPRATWPLTIKNKAKVKNCFIKNNSEKSLELARQLQAKEDIIVVTGSSFLVSEIKNKVHPKRQDFYER